MTRRRILEKGGGKTKRRDVQSYDHLVFSLTREINTNNPTTKFMKEKEYEKAIDVVNRCLFYF